MAKVIITKSSGNTTIHNLLSGLQGGSLNEYYHLTQEQYESLSQIGIIPDIQQVLEQGNVVTFDGGNSTIEFLAGDPNERTFTVNISNGLTGNLTRSNYLNLSPNSSTLENTVGTNAGGIGVSNGIPYIAYTNGSNITNIGFETPIATNAIYNFPAKVNGTYIFAMLSDIPATPDLSNYVTYNNISGDDLDMNEASIANVNTIFLDAIKLHDIALSEIATISQNNNDFFVYGNNALTSGFGMDMSNGNFSILSPISNFKSSITGIDNITGNRLYTVPDKNGNIALAVTDLLAMDNLYSVPTTVVVQTALNLKADITYVDGLVTSVFRAAGNWDASGNTFPTTGTGLAGAIRRGDTYIVSVSGTMGSIVYDVGDSFYANIANPGQTAGNWSKFEANTEQATPSFRGTVKLYTSLGTNTDGPVDQNTLNTQLNLKQPLDSDLTAIAALTTDSFGRGLLPLTSGAAVRTYIGAGTGSGDALTTNPLSQFASTTSAQLRGVLSDELGTGAALFDGATPTSFILTNATGLPISTGISGLGTGIAAFLATPSSANLITAITDETGTGALVFGTSPTLTTPNISGAAVFSTNFTITGGVTTNLIRGNGSVASSNGIVQGANIGTDATAGSRATLLSTTTFKDAVWQLQNQTNFLSMLNVVSPGSTYSLPVTNNQVYVTHTGTTATYTLPTVANGTAIMYTLINMGSGTVTVNSNAGGSDIWDSGSNVTTIGVTAGTTMILYGNSSKFIIL